MANNSSLAVAIVLLTGFGLCSPALAQETNAYTTAVNTGLSEFEEKNFLEARVHFARAYGLYPNARIMRALGMVYFELKNYVQSANYLSEALASRERPLDEDKRSKTQQLLARALDYIARVTLDIEPETTVTVDGKPTNLSSGSELVLTVGEHALEFRAKGKITDKRTLNVEGGEQESLRVRLSAAGSAAKESRTPETGETPTGRPVYKSPWLWTAVGLVLAGAAAGTAVALTRKAEKRVDDPYPGNGGFQPLTGAAQ